MKRGTIRRIGPEDLSAVADIYRDAIRRSGSAHYSPSQVEAWSSFADEEARFGEWIGRATTYVALDPDGQVIGFGGLDDRCRIASLYVASGHQRKGVGSRLVAHLLDRARALGCEGVSTEASAFSKPLFVRHGFKTTESEKTTFKGVEFTRYRMDLDLSVRAVSQSWAVDPGNESPHDPRWRPAGVFLALWFATWLVTVLTWERDAAGHSIGMAPPAIALHLVLPIVLGLVVVAWRAHGSSRSYGGQCALAGAVFGFFEFGVLALVDVLWLPQLETALPASEFLLGTLAGAVAYSALCVLLCLLGGWLGKARS